MTTLHRTDYPGAPVSVTSVHVDADNPGASVVGWSAIIGGAVAAAALGLLLITLGAGFGLAAASPWPGEGASATTIGVTAIIWLIIVQWVSSGLGGYIAGRMRTRGERSDEVFFRDTVHGFLAWALAMVVGASLMTVVAGAVANGGAELAGNALAQLPAGSAMRAATTPASGQATPGGGQAGANQAIQAPQSQPPATQSTQTRTAAPAGQAGSMVATESPSSRAVPARAGAGYEPFDYVIDAMFRSDRVGQAGQTGQSVNWETRGEAVRILNVGMWNGSISSQDKTYLAKLVAADTGISEAEAIQRIDHVIAQIRRTGEEARRVADEARKAGATISLFTAFAMLVGAFIAAVAGAIGGHDRDAI